MKKNYLLAVALAIMTMASCSDDNYVGDQEALKVGSEGAISFGSSTPTITRAVSDKTDGAAATDLNNNFVVFGYKTMSDASKQTVFNNYQVNYVTNTAHTTTSNSANWEYVGYKHLSADMTNNAGVTANATGDANDQTIKYWDFSASNYKFYGYSLGVGKTSDDPDTYANASLMSTSDTYTLQGNQDQLAACYISELNTISDPNGSTPTEVDLRFLSIKSKIQLGFYETIPGYSVKELKFYDSSSDATSDGTPVLFAGSSILPKAGTYTITFDSNGKPLLAWAAAVSDGTQANVSFSSTLTGYAARDYQEAAADNTYLGRASNAATLTEVKDILPYADGADLTLKVDYTLISRDGSGETIEAKGATAKIPAAFTQWKPNYKYTYLFKISDKSNPLIGEVTGLYPITLDAVVASEQDGSQETITTVSDPSITTYAKGEMVTANNEYLTSANIYIVVDNGTSLTVDTNAKLYTAEVEDGAAQGITEETVANAIAVNSDGYDAGTVLAVSADLTGYYEWNGSTYVTATTPADGVIKYYKPVTASVKDANGKKLVVKAAAGLSAITEIAAGDAPDGKAITVAGAKFTPSAEGYYVFEYTDGSSKKHYKVIKVVVAP